MTYAHGLPAGVARGDGARRDDLRARHRPLRARRPLRPGQGPRRAVRARPRARRADLRGRDGGGRRRRGDERHAAGRRPQLRRLRVGRDGRDRQPGGEAALHVGRRVPLVIRGSLGRRRCSRAQHNNSLEAWFAATPGLVVATPATPADTNGLIKSALRGDDP